ncbi:thiamine pyrophosphate-binding protein [Nonomuraea sp. NPDC050451]|uniref:thiamine pyrophosphate-binding protein n=1 Tax=Nonomuraea sp. NPDC050451 TaxID=3364364 RepID=UPI0037BC982B
MTQKTTAAAILDMLAALGVRTVYGLPGVHNMAFWRESAPDRPKITGVRHEQTAVYAADGLARAGGGLGVALTTTGPGAANAVAAFGEAWASGSPVLLIASEVPSAFSSGPRTGTVHGVLHQSPDQAALFEPLAKAVYRPRDAQAAVAAVADAARTALRHPRGPVYLDIPSDVLDRPAEPLPVLVQDEPPPPRQEQVNMLVAELTAAPRIVLWVGGGAIQSEAAHVVDMLARRLGAPVVTSYGGRGVLPPDHPLLVGLPPHEPEVEDLIAKADLLVALGTRFDGMMTRNWRMPMPDRLASVNCSAADLTGNYRPDVGVLGDVRTVVAAALDRLPGGDRTPYADLEALRSDVWSRLAADDRTRTAVRLLDSVERALPTGTRIVADMTISGYWYGSYGAVRRPRDLQYPVGWGTLGYALPAAIGAADAGGPVLALVGDGGIMFALGELATLAQEGPPITVLLVDDGGYGVLRYDQEHAGHACHGVDLVAPHWLTLARSFGIEAAEVTDPGEPLQDTLATALRAGSPRLVVLRTTLTPPRTTSPRWFE